MRPPVLSSAQTREYSARHIGAARYLQVHQYILADILASQTSKELTDSILSTGDQSWM